MEESLAGPGGGTRLPGARPAGARAVTASCAGGALYWRGDAARLRAAGAAANPGRDREGSVDRNFYREHIYYF